MLPYYWIDHFKAATRASVDSVVASAKELATAVSGSMGTTTNEVSSALGGAMGANDTAAAASNWTAVLNATTSSAEVSAAAALAACEAVAAAADKMASREATYERILIALVAFGLGAIFSLLLTRVLPRTTPTEEQIVTHEDADIDHDASGVMVLEPAPRPESPNELNNAESPSTPPASPFQPIPFITPPSASKKQEEEEEEESIKKHTIADEKVTWHSDKDIPRRIEMIQHLVKLLRKDKNGSPEAMNKIPRMAKRLEVELYQNARSFEAYFDSTTLQARLQHAAAEASRKDKKKKAAQNLNQASADETDVEVKTMEPDLEHKSEDSSAGPSIDAPPGAPPGVEADKKEGDKSGQSVSEGKAGSETSEATTKKDGEEGTTDTKPSSWARALGIFSRKAVDHAASAAVMHKDDKAKAARKENTTTCAAAAAATKQAADEARRQSKQVEKDWSDQAWRLHDEQELAETDEARRNAEAEAASDSDDETVGVEIDQKKDAPDTDDETVGVEGDQKKAANSTDKTTSSDSDDETVGLEESQKEGSAANAPSAATQSAELLQGQPDQVALEDRLAKLKEDIARRQKEAEGLLIKTVAKAQEAAEASSKTSKHLIAAASIAAAKISNSDKEVQQKKGAILTPSPTTKPKTAETKTNAVATKENVPTFVQTKAIDAKGRESAIKEKIASPIQQETGSEERHQNTTDTKAKPDTKDRDSAPWRKLEAFFNSKRKSPPLSSPPKTDNARAKVPNKEDISEKSDDEETQDCNAARAKKSSSHESATLPSTNNERGKLPSESSNTSKPSQAMTTKLPPPSWYLRIQELKEFRDRSGHVNPKNWASDSNERELALWLRSERASYNGGFLLPAKLEALRNLGCTGFGESIGTKSSSCGTEAEIAITEERIKQAISEQLPTVEKSTMTVKTFSKLLSTKCFGGADLKSFRCFIKEELTKAINEQAQEGEEEDANGEEPEVEDDNESGKRATEETSSKNAGDKRKKPHADISSEKSEKAIRDLDGVKRKARKEQQKSASWRASIFGQEAEARDTSPTKLPRESSSSSTSKKAAASPEKKGKGFQPDPKAPNVVPPSFSLINEECVLASLQDLERPYTIEDLSAGRAAFVCPDCHEWCKYFPSSDAHFGQFKFLEHEGRYVVDFRDTSKLEESARDCSPFRKWQRHMRFHAREKSGSNIALKRDLPPLYVANPMTETRKRSITAALVCDKTGQPKKMRVKEEKD